jgi:hypothetical protein
MLPRFGLLVGDALLVAGDGGGRAVSLAAQVAVIATRAGVWSITTAGFGETSIGLSSSNRTD